MVDHLQTEKNIATEDAEDIERRVSHISISTARAGVENLFDKTPPHESYEGAHRYDPKATWTQDEESALLRKTDLYLLSWVCLMVRCRSQPNQTKPIWLWN